MAPISPIMQPMRQFSVFREAILQVSWWLQNANEWSRINARDSRTTVARRGLKSSEYGRQHGLFAFGLPCSVMVHSVSFFMPRLTHQARHTYSPPVAGCTGNGDGPAAYFFCAASIFFRYFAGSLLKSFRQPLQQSFTSCPL